MISKILKFLPALFIMVLVAACGGDDPETPGNNGDNGDDNPTEEISTSDFVGAWVQDVDYDPIYRIFNSDLTGMTVLNDDPDDPSAIRRQAFEWKYRNETLTLSFKSTKQVFTVIKISEKSMTLMDEDGYKETYRRIKQSEVPGYTDDDDGDDPNDNKEDSDKDKDNDPPYANYMYVNGKYYEITKIQSSVHHSTDSGDSNSKMFCFFGENGLLKPEGFYIDYNRPSWDGIDNWTTGTYDVIAAGSENANKYYYYVGGGYAPNMGGFFGAEGTFKISRSGDYTTYDFEGETYYPSTPFKIHVVSKRQ